MAERLQKLDRRDEALQVYDQAIERYPHSWELHYRRAQNRLALGDRLGAIGDVSTAIELNENEPTLLFFRGRWLIESGSFSAGIRDLTTLLDMELEQQSNFYVRSALLSRAVAAYLSGDFANARSDCDQLSRETTTYLAGTLWSVDKLRGALRRS